MAVCLYLLSFPLLFFILFKIKSLYSEGDNQFRKNFNHPHHVSLVQTKAAGYLIYSGRYACFMRVIWVIIVIRVIRVIRAIRVIRVI